VAQAWWQVVLLAILLRFSAAGIGFNIQHDGGHQAYSNRAWVNKLMAMTLELIGGSSYLWRVEARRHPSHLPIAEEVAVLYPELVMRTATGEVQTVKYQELMPMLLNELQRQQDELWRQKCGIDGSRIPAQGVGRTARANGISF
jgi:hypothetical protein